MGSVLVRPHHRANTPRDLEASSTGVAAPRSLTNRVAAAVTSGRRQPAGAEHRAALAAGRALGRRGVNFAVVLGPRPAHRSVPVRRRRPATRSRDCACPARSGTSGTAGLDRCGAGLVYGLRAHGPWRAGTGPSIQPAQAAARPLCARDRRPTSSWHSRTFRRRPRPPAPHGHARQRAPGAEGAGRRRPLRLAATTARRARRWPTRCCTNCTCAASPGCTPTCPAQRGTYAGLASERRSRTAARWASPRSACCRCTSSSTSSGWSAWACATTGATTRWASSAPTRATPLPAAAGRARRIPAHGATAARGRHRGHSGRGLQPHGGSRRDRPHAQLARAGQRQLLPPDRPNAGVDYDNHSGCGNTLDIRQPRGAADW